MKLVLLIFVIFLSLNISAIEISLPLREVQHSNSDFLFDGYFSKDFSRHYSPQSKDNGFGPGWSTNYSQRLLIGKNPTLIKLHNPTTELTILFAKRSNKEMWTSNISRLTIEKKEEGYQLRHPYYSLYFDMRGFLTKEVRGNLSLAFMRDKRGRLLRINGPSMGFWDFSWKNNRITQVKSKDKKVIYYKYKKGLLESVGSLSVPFYAYIYKNNKLSMYQDLLAGRTHKISSKKSQITLIQKSKSGTLSTVVKNIRTSSSKKEFLISKTAKSKGKKTTTSQMKIKTSSKTVTEQDIREVTIVPNLKRKRRKVANKSFLGTMVLNSIGQINEIRSPSATVKVKYDRSHRPIELRRTNHIFPSSVGKLKTSGSNTSKKIEIYKIKYSRQGEFKKITSSSDGIITFGKKMNMSKKKKLIELWGRFRRS